MVCFILLTKMVDILHQTAETGSLIGERDDQVITLLEMIDSRFPDKSHLWLSSLKLRCVHEARMAVKLNLKGDELVSRLKYALSFLLQMVRECLKPEVKDKYNYLVYEATLIFWDVSRPLMRSGWRKKIVDDFMNLWQALQQVATLPEPPTGAIISKAAVGSNSKNSGNAESSSKVECIVDIPWRIELATQLSLCLEDSGRAPEGIKLLEDAWGLLKSHTNLIEDLHSAWGGSRKDPQAPADDPVNSPSSLAQWLPLMVLGVRSEISKSVPAAAANLKKDAEAVGGFWGKILIPAWLLLSGGQQPGAGGVEMEIMTAWKVIDPQIDQFRASRSLERDKYLDFIHNRGLSTEMPSLSAEEVEFAAKMEDPRNVAALSALGCAWLIRVACKFKKWELASDLLARLARFRPPITSTCRLLMDVSGAEILVAYECKKPQIDNKTGLFLSKQAQEQREVESILKSVSSISEVLTQLASVHEETEIQSEDAIVAMWRIASSMLGTDGLAISSAATTRIPSIGMNAKASVIRSLDRALRTLSTLGSNEFPDLKQRILFELAQVDISKDLISSARDFLEKAFRVDASLSDSQMPFVPLAESNIESLNWVHPPKKSTFRRPLDKAIEYQIHEAKLQLSLIDAANANDDCLQLLHQCKQSVNTLLQERISLKANNEIISSSASAEIDDESSSNSENESENEAVNSKKSKKTQQMKDLNKKNSTQVIKKTSINNGVSRLQGSRHSSAVAALHRLLQRLNQQLKSLESSRKKAAASLTAQYDRALVLWTDECKEIQKVFQAEQKDIQEKLAAGGAKGAGSSPPAAKGGAKGKAEEGPVLPSRPLLPTLPPLTLSEENDVKMLISMFSETAKLASSIGVHDVALQAANHALDLVDFSMVTDAIPKPFSQSLSDDDKAQSKKTDAKQTGKGGNVKGGGEPRLNFTIEIPRSVEFETSQSFLKPGRSQQKQAEDGVVEEDGDVFVPPIRSIISFPVDVSIGYSIISAALARAAAFKHKLVTELNTLPGIREDSTSFNRPSSPKNPEEESGNVAKLSKTSKFDPPLTIGLDLIECIDDEKEDNNSFENEKNDLSTNKFANIPSIYLSPVQAEEAHDLKCRCAKDLIFALKTASAFGQHIRIVEVLSALWNLVSETVANGFFVPPFAHPTVCFAIQEGLEIALDGLPQELILVDSTIQRLLSLCTEALITGISHAPLLPKGKSSNASSSDASSKGKPGSATGNSRVSFVVDPSILQNMENVSLKVLAVSQRDARKVIAGRLAFACSLHRRPIPLIPPPINSSSDPAANEKSTSPSPSSPSKKTAGKGEASSGSTGSRSASAAQIEAEFSKICATVPLEEGGEESQLRLVQAAADILRNFDAHPRSDFELAQQCEMWCRLARVCLECAAEASNSLILLASAKTAASLAGSETNATEGGGGDKGKKGGKDNKLGGASIMADADKLALLNARFACPLLRKAAIVCASTAVGLLVKNGAPAAGADSTSFVEQKSAVDRLTVGEASRTASRRLVFWMGHGHALLARTIFSFIDEKKQNRESITLLRQQVVRHACAACRHAIRCNSSSLALLGARSLWNVAVGMLRRRTKSDMHMICEPLSFAASSLVRTKLDGEYTFRENIYAGIFDSVTVTHMWSIADTSFEEALRVLPPDHQSQILSPILHLSSLRGESVSIAVGKVKESSSNARASILMLLASVSSNPSDQLSAFSDAIELLTKTKQPRAVDCRIQFADWLVRRFAAYDLAREQCKAAIDYIMALEDEVAEEFNSVTTETDGNGLDTRSRKLSKSSSTSIKAGRVKPQNSRISRNVDGIELAVRRCQAIKNQSTVSKNIIGTRAALKDSRYSSFTDISLSRWSVDGCLPVPYLESATRALISLAQLSSSGSDQVDAMLSAVSLIVKSFRNTVNEGNRCIAARRKVWFTRVAASVAREEAEAACDVRGLRGRSRAAAITKMVATALGQSQTPIGQDVSPPAAGESVTLLDDENSLQNSKDALIPPMERPYPNYLATATFGLPETSLEWLDSIESILDPQMLRAIYCHAREISAKHAFTAIPLGTSTIAPRCLGFSGAFGAPYVSHELLLWLSTELLNKGLDSWSVPVLQMHKLLILSIDAKLRNELQLDDAALQNLTVSKIAALREVRERNLSIVQDNLIVNKINHRGPSKQMTELCMSPFTASVNQAEDDDSSAPLIGSGSDPLLQSKIAFSWLLMDLRLGLVARRSGHTPLATEKFAQVMQVLASPLCELHLDEIMSEAEMFSVAASSASNSSFNKESKSSKTVDKEDRVENKDFSFSDAKSGLYHQHLVPLYSAGTAFESRPLPAEPRETSTIKQAKVLLALATDLFEYWGEQDAAAFLCSKTQRLCELYGDTETLALSLSLRSSIAATAGSLQEMLQLSSTCLQVIPNRIGISAQQVANATVISFESLSQLGKSDIANSVLKNAQMSLHGNGHEVTGSLIFNRNQWGERIVIPHSMNPGILSSLNENKGDNLSPIIIAQSQYRVAKISVLEHLKNLCLHVTCQPFSLNANILTSQSLSILFEASTILDSLVHFELHSDCLEWAVELLNPFIFTLVPSLIKIAWVTCGDASLSPYVRKEAFNPVIQVADKMVLFAEDCQRSLNILAALDDCFTLRTCPVGAFPLANHALASKNNPSLVPLSATHDPFTNLPVPSPDIARVRNSIYRDTSTKFMVIRAATMRLAASLSRMLDEHSQLNSQSAGHGARLPFPELSIEEALENGSRVGMGFSLTHSTVSPEGFATPMMASRSPFETRTGGRGGFMSEAGTSKQRMSLKASLATAANKIDLTHLAVLPNDDVMTFLSAAPPEIQELAINDSKRLDKWIRDTTAGVNSLPQLGRTPVQVLDALQMAGLAPIPHIDRSSLARATSPVEKSFAILSSLSQWCISTPDPLKVVASINQAQSSEDKLGTLMDDASLFLSASLEELCTFAPSGAENKLDSILILPALLCRNRRFWLASEADVKLSVERGLSMLEVFAAKRADSIRNAISSGIGGSEIAEKKKLGVIWDDLSKTTIEKLRMEQEDRLSNALRHQVSSEGGAGKGRNAAAAAKKKPVSGMKKDLNDAVDSSELVKNALPEEEFSILGLLNESMKTEVASSSMFCGPVGLPPGFRKAAVRLLQRSAVRSLACLDWESSRHAIEGLAFEGFGNLNGKCMKWSVEYMMMLQGVETAIRALNLLERGSRGAEGVTPARSLWLKMKELKRLRQLWGSESGIRAAEVLETELLSKSPLFKRLMLHPLLPGGTSGNDFTQPSLLSRLLPRRLLSVSIQMKDGFLYLIAMRTPGPAQQDIGQGKNNKAAVNVSSTLSSSNSTEYFVQRVPIRATIMHEYIGFLVEAKQSVASDHLKGHFEPSRGMGAITNVINELNYLIAPLWQSLSLSEIFPFGGFDFSHPDSPTSLLLLPCSELESLPWESLSCWKEFTPCIQSIQRDFSLPLFLQRILLAPLSPSNDSLVASDPNVSPLLNLSSQDILPPVNDSNAIMKDTTTTNAWATAFLSIPSNNVTLVTDPFNEGRKSLSKTSNELISTLNLSSAYHLPHPSPSAFRITQADNESEQVSANGKKTTSKSVTAPIQEIDDGTKLRPVSYEACYSEMLATARHSSVLIHATPGNFAQTLSSSAFRTLSSSSKKAAVEISPFICAGGLDFTSQRILIDLGSGTITSGSHKRLSKEAGTSKSQVSDDAIIECNNLDSALMASFNGVGCVVSSCSVWNDEALEFMMEKMTKSLIGGKCISQAVDSLWIDNPRNDRKKEIIDDEGESYFVSSKLWEQGLTFIFGISGYKVIAPQEFVKGKKK